jgi:formyltetrahydrofolate-dependent phosphoribosylglycinamide formyltransferase
MLKKLQAKWKVNGWSLLFIICTFAIGGSLCGFAARKLLLLTGLEKNLLWVILYITLLTILWPICVLIVSIPLGQFSFFRIYIYKIWSRMRLRRNFNNMSTDDIYHIAIFASGAGSNAKKIIEYFKNDPKIKISLLVSNKSNAGVLQIARDNKIEQLLINKMLPLDGGVFIEELKKRGINFIVLAGFLLKIPPALIRAFPKKIINIHPALLPAYGGKGMYGMHVHEAVISASEKQSGISIHYVDELYDHGDIIFQATCNIEPGDTPEILALKIHSLEHAHYPAQIAQLLKKQKAR